MTNVGRNLVLFRTATFKYIFKYGQKISRPEGEEIQKGNFSTSPTLTEVKKNFVQKSQTSRLDGKY